LSNTCSNFRLIREWPGLSVGEYAMHIGIDIKNYALYQSGIFNATYPLVNGFLEKRPDIDFTLVGPAAGFRPFRHWPHCRHLPIEIPRIRRGEYLYNFVSFPLRFGRSAFDLFYSPYFDLWIPKRQPFVITIHDLVHFRLPELYHPLLKGYLCQIQKRNARLARHIFTISNTSKRDIVELLGIDERKVSIVDNPISEELLRPPNGDLPESWLSEWRLAERSVVLYTGGVEHRKNLSRLLKAFQGLPRDYLLVLTGNPRAYHKYQHPIDDLAKDKRLWFCGFLPRRQLRQLYHHCNLIVYPSLWEGFGYPIIEAMAVRKPIACSNLASLPEVGGDYPIYFDPYRIDDIRRAIREGAAREIPESFVFPDKYRLDQARQVFRKAFEKLL
jgi:glycosyltransferase involved in cell wall biosynthesis